ncbi:dTDP-4-amino-4,6-dideoxygalactose transaminase [Melghirimyces algeriensis]|uniref:dTDP-4-amino-4,6-dideoxygalactose transaminase n=1 Tax=Melghirimyces algeriensis TaxID=910412 RepID=A0A521ADB6_9BACL|nr:dTDP-4-amino-4,6-dideoxygalactose transaminase [Melghirimyces algeriensis]
MIPLMDIRRQHQTLKKDIAKAVDHVLESSRFVLGEHVEALESEIAKTCGTSYAVAVNSGTDALFLSLRALGIGKGDEVITSPYTFFATVEAIIQTGAQPVLVDIDPQTYNLDPNQVEQSITDNTKAILPVHLFGCPADLTALRSIAQQYQLKMVEDACQAIGARFAGKGVGSWGDTGCFSFYPTKNLGGSGDGGMIVTSDPELMEEIRLLRSHGSYKKYHHCRFAYNSRLDEIQAAILRVKNQYLPSWNQKRRTLAQRYNQAFQKLPLKPQWIPSEAESVYHLYIVRTSQAEALNNWLTQSGIGCGIYYPLPLHHQKAWTDQYPVPDLPQAESVANTTLALPLFPEMTESEQETVIQAVTRFFDKGESHHATIY